MRRLAKLFSNWTRMSISTQSGCLLRTEQQSIVKDRFWGFFCIIWWRRWRRWLLRPSATKFYWFWSIYRSSSIWWWNEKFIEFWSSKVRKSMSWFWMYTLRMPIVSSIGKENRPIIKLRKAGIYKGEHFQQVKTSKIRARYNWKKTSQSLNQDIHS